MSLSKGCHPGLAEGCHPELVEGIVTLSLSKGEARLIGNLAFFPEIRSTFMAAADL